MGIMLLRRIAGGFALAAITMPLAAQTPDHAH